MIRLTPRWLLTWGSVDILDISLLLFSFRPFCMIEVYIALLKFQISNGFYTFS